MPTLVIIDTEDFSLECPHCNEALEEIRIRRIFDPKIECPLCFAEFELTISTEV